jgi:hypothetical protein
MPKFQFQQKKSSVKIDVFNFGSTAVLSAAGIQGRIGFVCGKVLKVFK